MAGGSPSQRPRSRAVPGRELAVDSSRVTTRGQGLSSGSGSALPQGTLGQTGERVPVAADWGPHCGAVE